VQAADSRGTNCPDTPESPVVGVLDESTAAQVQPASRRYIYGPGDLLGLLHDRSLLSLALIVLLGLQAPARRLYLGRCTPDC
jgi:hypothetical protein